MLLFAQLREDMMSCHAIHFVHWDAFGPGVDYMELVDQSRWLGTRKLMSLNV